jgi:hypothetical protein
VRTFNYFLLGLTENLSGSLAAAWVKGRLFNLAALPEVQLTWRLELGDPNPYVKVFAGCQRQLDFWQSPAAEGRQADGVRSRVFRF